jgi:tRNA 2-selenouridine synthase
MINLLSISGFLEMDKTIPVADVRAPAEFEQGHIAGAFNIPIFSNEERVQVGTTYKQAGREQAILSGFDLTGPKWSGFIRQALEIAPEKKIRLHCWRGGMRSGAMAWALNLYGFDVYLLEGGYKKYRRWVLDKFTEQFHICILGGMTGSGKTHVLYEFKEYGEQVIDLEDLAQHQGSSYGSMGKLTQPTQEQFENNLATQLNAIYKEKQVWLEDESLTIGKRFIPNPLWHQMRKAIVFNMAVPAEERINLLVYEYGKLDKQFLLSSTERIAKRLGPEQTRNAVLAIKEGRMKDFIKIVLFYYDKTYRTGQSKRQADTIYTVTCENTVSAINAKNILKYIKELYSFSD